MKEIIEAFVKGGYKPLQGFILEEEDNTIIFSSGSPFSTQEPIFSLSKWIEDFSTIAIVSGSSLIFMISAVYSKSVNKFLKDYESHTSFDKPLRSVGFLFSLFLGEDDLIAEIFVDLHQGVIDLIFIDPKEIRRVGNARLLLYKR